MFLHSAVSSCDVKRHKLSQPLARCQVRALALEVLSLPQLFTRQALGPKPGLSWLAEHEGPWFLSFSVLGCGCRCGPLWGVASCRREHAGRSGLGNPRPSSVHDSCSPDLTHLSKAVVLGQEGDSIFKSHGARLMWSHRGRCSPMSHPLPGF